MVILSLRMKKPRLYYAVEFFSIYLRWKWLTHKQLCTNKWFEFGKLNGVRFLLSEMFISTHLSVISLPIFGSCTTPPKGIFRFESLSVANVSIIRMNTSILLLNDNGKWLKRTASYWFYCLDSRHRTQSEWNLRSRSDEILFVLLIVIIMEVNWTEKNLNCILNFIQCSSLFMLPLSFSLLQHWTFPYGFQLCEWTLISHSSNSALYITVVFLL